MFLFDLGYFKLAAFAKIAAAQAYFLSRLNHQTMLREVVGGRHQLLDLSRCLAHEPRSLLEKAVVLGAREQVAARLIGVRMPEAIVNERRRQARAVAKKRGDTPSQAHLTLLAWNLFITNVPPRVAAADRLCRLLFKMASRTGVQDLEKWPAFGHGDDHHET